MRSTKPQFGGDAMQFQTNLFHTRTIRRRWSRLYIALAVIWVAVTEFLYEYFGHELHHLDRILTTAAQALILVGAYFFVVRHLSHRFTESERIYQTLIEFSPQPLLVKANGRWIYANPAALRLVGAEAPEDVVGHSIWEIIHPDDREIITSQIQKVYRTHSPTDLLVEKKLVRLDGTVVDVEVYAAPIEIDGQPAIQAVYSDVTERKRIEQQRDDALSELQAFLEHNTDAVILFDTTGCITTMNTQFENLFGVQRDEWIGHFWTEASFTSQQDSRTAELVLDSILHGYTISDYRTVITTFQQQMLHVSISAFPLRDDNDKEIGYAVTWRDISYEKETEAYLLRSEKLAAIGELAAGVAHEIRNPLTAVLGFLQLVSELARGKYQDYFDLMSSELNRISSIVSEMLILAKPQADSYERIRLPEILQDTANLLTSEALKYNCELTSNLDISPVHLTVKGNASRLKQLFINLIRNAIDAVKDSSNKTIEIYCCVQQDNVLVQIKDTGCGMSQEQLQRLIEPFYTTKEHGTGLGLHICQKIVDEHAGRLWFETSLDVGTTASILLPLLMD